MLRTTIETISTWAVPVVVAAIPTIGLVRGVKVYPVFLEGARQGFDTAVRIIPPLVAIVVALGMLKGSGAMDAFAHTVAPLTTRLGIPTSVLPMMVVRPLSGGAALGVVGDVLRTEGADS